MVFERRSRYITVFPECGTQERSAFLDGAENFIQVCYHTLFGLVLEELARIGWLQPFPSPVPEHFGVFIVHGKVF